MTKKYWLDFGDNKTIIDNLPGYTRQRIKNTLKGLATNPRPKGSKPLKDDLEGLYRIRVDHYRIIYAIHEEIITVVIVSVDERDNQTYKGLPAFD